ncbi:TPA: hypothetical protein KAT19_001425 [Escherichia coli]|nr:hypothetical protein [Escherichia coli]HBB4034682.1 hypothetical protein [Escherichia coli]
MIGFVIDLRIFLRNFLCIFSGIFPWIFHPTEGASGLPEMTRLTVLVLTAGSHFKAMKSLILQHIPEACILGLFVARTTRGAQII